MVTALLLTGVVAAGCSTLRLAYGQAPKLAFLWLDRYADFDDGQTPRVRAALERLFAWHRREQLADDAALLDQAAREALQDLTPAQACAWWDRLDERRTLYLAQAAPALAEIGPLLTPAQWQHIQQRIDKSNADWRDDHLRDDPRERERLAVERVIDRAETFYGRLDRPQRAFVASRMQQSPWDARRWHDERLADQRDLMQTLRELARPDLDPDRRLALSQAFLARVSQPGNDAYRAHHDRLREDQCAFAAELHQRTTPRQRQKAADTLRGWAGDLRSQIAP